MPTSMNKRDAIIRKVPTEPQQTDLVSEARERVATPPVSIKCAICGETIYLSFDRWYHLNTGGRRCPPLPVDEADHD